MAIVRRGGDERGASLVEFAIILPIFMMLVLGMFSGGIAYNRKQEMTHASREGARFGATVLVNPSSSTSGSVWAAGVADVVSDESNGEIQTSDVCVALVQGTNGSTVWTPPAQSSNRYTTGAVNGFPANCFSDTDTNTDARVHVAVKAEGKIEALLFSYPVNLTSRSVARYERTLPT